MRKYDDVTGLKEVHLMATDSELTGTSNTEKKAKTLYEGNVSNMNILF